jgi:hypothetical protein
MASLALISAYGTDGAEPVLAANRPDQRGVALDECIPRPDVAVSGAGDQADDHRVIARLIDVALHKFTWATGCLSAHGLVLLSNHRPEYRAARFRLFVF